MSGDPLMRYWFSTYDVAPCLFGMCECHDKCYQARVRDGEPTYGDLMDRITMLEMQLLQRPSLWRAGDET